MKSIQINVLAMAFLAGLVNISCKNDNRTMMIHNYYGNENSTSSDFTTVTGLDDDSLKNITDDASLMTMRSGFDNSNYLLDQSTRKAYYYVEAKADKYVAEGKRTPLNISIVIDHSGSMAGEKLKYAKKAAEYVVGKLSNDDFVSVVMYDSKVDVVASSQSASNRNDIMAKISGIRDAGGTNLSGGMMEGYTQVKSTFKKGYVNRVLLMSDGLANEGITSQDALQKIAKEYCTERGISISTFGIGLDYNENLMTGLAEFGCGNYYFIDDPEHIPSIFEKELNGMMNLVAANVKLSVKIPAGLSLDKAFGYKYELEGNTVIFNFRDVFSEETKAVLLRLNINDDAKASLAIESKLSFTCAVKEPRVDRVLTTENNLNPTSDRDAYAASINDKVKEQVVLFESNERLEEAMKAVDEGRYEKAREITTSNTTYLEENAKYVNKSAELQKQFKDNDDYNTKIKEVETMQESDKKMMQKSTKSMNYSTRKKK